MTDMGTKEASGKLGISQTYLKRCHTDGRMLNSTMGSLSLF